jgi:MoaA/NifB/PqqE/SkfB family radical SAM enzyme
MTPKENILITDKERNDKKIVVAGFPRTLTIESTTACNLRCVMCPHSLDAVHRPKHMPKQLFDKLATALGLAREIQLHGIGEPLLSPSFWQILEQAPFHPDTALSINTNMTILNADKIKTLTSLPAKLTINISLDAARPETYRRIRGGDLNKVLANIAALRDARHGAYPFLCINMTMMRENIEEAVEFIEMGHRLGIGRIYLWHLNKIPDCDKTKYTSTREDWTFDYLSQGLWNFKALSNRCVRAAIQRAEELNIPLELDKNKILFYDIENDRGALT